MKKISLFLLLILFTFSNAQNGLKVEYESVSKQNHFKNSTLSQQTIEKGKEMFNKPKKFTLLYSDGNSLFRSEIPMEIYTKEVGHTTSQEKGIKVEKTSLERLKMRNVKILHKKDRKGFFQYHKFDKEEFYHYLEPEITSIEYKEDTTYIDIYKCKLVHITYKNGMIAKVWYTENIPINCGPFIYNNLPGMVLKVETKNMLIYAIKVSEFQTPDDMEYLNENIKVYNDSEFQKKKRELMLHTVKKTSTLIRQ